MPDLATLRVEKGAAGTVTLTCPRLDPEHIMELRTLVDTHDLYRLADRTVFVIPESGLDTFRAAYARGGTPTLSLPTVMEVYYDYVSPYSYLSTKIVEMLEEQYDIWVDWRGFELRPAWVEFPGWWYAPSASGQRWIERRDLVRKYRLAMADTRPPFRPRTRPLLKAGEYAKTVGKFGPFQRAVFAAYYDRGEDIRSAGVVARLGESVGLHGRQVVDAMTSATWEPALEQARRDAERDGIFGVPTYKVGSAVIWGRDPVDALREALEAAGARRRAAPGGQP